MKKFVPYYFLVAVIMPLILGFSGCHKPGSTDNPPAKANPVITLKFQASASGNPLVFGNVISNPGNGQRYFINTLLFYVGNARLVKSDGTEDSLKKVLLVNFDDNINTDDPTHDPATVGTSFSFSIPGGTYKAIRFGIGVPASLNGHSKTGKFSTDYPSGDPLGYYRGTYWSSWDNYRTEIIEGKVDSSKSNASTPTSPFGYHTGFDSLYREIEFTDNFSLDKGQSHTITIDLDVNKIFYNSSYQTNLITEASTNMSGTLSEALTAQKIANSVILALSKK